MSSKSTLFRSALLSLHRTRLHGLAPTSLSGVGVIFMLHRVRPQQDLQGFEPNGILEITPDYLNAVLTTVSALNYDLVSLDEAHRRLRDRQFGKKFAVFTLDDGYQDNLKFAAPIFAKHAAPFTVYVSSGMPDHTTKLWWIGLEEVIRKIDQIDGEIRDTEFHLPTVSAMQMQTAFDTIYQPLRDLPQTEQRLFITKLCEKYDVDLLKITADCSLSWNEVRELSDHAYCTIGAHTVDHYALSKLSEPDARQEMVQGANRIKQETGHWPRHLAYPYGDTGSAGPREFELARFLGFDTATTTQKGFVTEKHGCNPHAIPRLSLNGDYQDLRMLEVLMSGLPFALASLIPSLQIA